MSRALRTLLLSTLALAALAAPVPASPARDELLRHVPSDVGFCLVVQGLRDKLADVLASPLAKEGLKALPALAGAEEWKHLADAEAYLKKHLGVGWADLRDDLLGDALAFAYRPGPPDRPEQEQGLIALRARDAKKLATLIDKLNALQKQTGELTGLTPREHKEVKYVRREEKKGATFYLLRGPLLLFSGQEAMLRQAIDADKALAANAEPPLLKRLRGLKLDKALAVLLVQPRGWDDAVAKGPAGKHWAACWKALQGIGIGLSLDRDVRIDLALQARADALPAPARKLLTAAATPSALWAHFPDDALFAAGGRIDLAALYEFFCPLLAKATREQLEAELERGLGAVLGKDILKEIVPALGPDWGVCVTAPPAGKVWAPRVVAACKVARGPEADPIDETILAGVTTGAQLLILAHNKKSPAQTVRLRTQSQGSVKVRYLDGDGVFPPGVQPAYSLKSGYLVLGSSPEQIKAFAGGGKVSGTSAPLLRVSFKSWRAYLKDRREPLAEALARSDKTTREIAGKKLDALRAALEWVDRVELRQAVDRDRATFSLVLTPSKSITRARP